MTRAKIKAAEAEARRFLAAVKAVSDVDKRASWEAQDKPIASSTYSPNVSPKLTGTLRRASMDLTRALAEMRRPG